MIFKSDVQRVLYPQTFFPYEYLQGDPKNSVVQSMLTFTKPHLTSKKSMKTIPESLWHSISRGRGRQVFCQLLLPGAIAILIRK